MKELTVDVECYPNYFLAQFKDHSTGKIVSLEKFNDSPLNRRRLFTIMKNNRTIAFNSLHYDLPMISAAVQGFNNASLKKLSDEIIKGEKSIWVIIREYEIRMLTDVDHIDLKEPAPGVMVSLKTYGGRLNAPRLQDLPIDPDTVIDESQRIDLVEYCENDLDTTWLLYTNIMNEINIREDLSMLLGKDLRSKGGAQVAKEYILIKMKKFPKARIVKGTIGYYPPSYLSFEDEAFNSLFELVKDTRFTIKSSGHVQLPAAIAKAVPFDGAKYKIGIGGLHSQEKKQTYISENGYVIEDRDVTSYYPSLILGSGLYPKVLGPAFLKTYEEIYNDRLHAKARKDASTSESLKLVLNSTFGLFGNKYSPFYEPEAMLNITLTGQFALLMLIEMLSKENIKTISANTDGVVLYYHQDQFEDVERICLEWEIRTGFNLEENRYKGIYSAGVNTYLALTTYDSFKTKGPLAAAGLRSNPQGEICSIAVQNLIKDQIPLEDTIRECKDITKFLVLRNVKGGGIWKDQYLGKVVRWYWGKEGSEINYKSNGNKVPKSEGAIPCMDLPSNFPENIDYDRYLFEANKILIDIGYKKA